MPRTKSDPLLAALIAKLPPTNTEWLVERQLAWLNLMAMAFGTVYGGDAAARLGIKVDGSALSSASPATASSAAPAFVKPKPSYPFIIDEHGYVRDKKGKQVLPTQVTDMIVDLRGEGGDLREIVWADGSTGLNGADLTITTV